LRLKVIFWVSEVIYFLEIGKTPSRERTCSTNKPDYKQAEISPNPKYSCFKQITSVKCQNLLTELLSSEADELPETEKRKLINKYIN